MGKKRGDLEEVDLLKKRLEALEFKISSFNELEEKIYDFFSNFEEKVTEIVDKRLKDVKIPDVEKILKAKIEDLKESLLNNSGSSESSSKINLLSKEIDELRKEMAPMEYINMLEAEFRNKFKSLNERLNDKPKQESSKDKSSAKENALDEDVLSKLKEQMEKNVNEIGLLQDQIKDLREMVISKSPIVIKDELLNLKKQIDALKIKPAETKPDTKVEVNPKVEVNLNDITSKIENIYNEYEQFKVYTIKQMNKIAEWFIFLDRCIK